jgi:hypothetical protein
MLYFSNSGSTQTLTIWPEVSASIALEPSGGLELKVVQDYDQSETIIPATLLNTPTKYNPRLVFSVLTANIPEYGGLYTVELKETIGRRTKWGETDVEWSAANWKWSDPAGRTFSNILDTDRGTVQGTDSSIITQYFVSSSENIYESGSLSTFKVYESPDENGTYTTYH